MDILNINNMTMYRLHSLIHRWGQYRRRQAVYNLINHLRSEDIMGNYKGYGEFVIPLILV